MKFKRLLTAGLMALLCAGTATAASQLNSVHVTPKASTATVSLQTHGSFAHKEYRPDDHRLLIDLTGVISDPSLVHSVVFRSPVLKSYLLSNYTNAAGTEVTRLELTLGDNVTADVVDSATGLEILLSGGAPASAPAPVTASAAPAPAPAQAVVPAPSPAHPVSQNAVAASRNTGTQPAAKVDSSAHLALPESAHEKGSLTPSIIRNVSVRRGNDSLDVIVDGPSAAYPFLLKSPDRLVMDFNNTVMEPSSKTIAVHAGDVTKIRVGLFQSKPPVTRVVIDLNGPKGFEVLPSADQVVVRVKTDSLAKSNSPFRPVSVSVPAPVVAPALPKRPAPATTSVMPAVTPKPTPSVMPAVAPKPTPSVTPSVASHDKPAPATGDAAVVPVPSAPSTKDAASPVASSAPKPQNQPPAAPSVSAPVATVDKASTPSVSVPAAPAPVLSAAMAADTTAPSVQAAKAAVEIARLTAPADAQPSDMGAAASPFPERSRPKYTGEPISVNLKDVDLKDFFRLIHEISGLNVVLDPSVKGTLTLVLDDVPWDQALDIVLKNNALDRELQGNVLRIAAGDTLRREAVDRRAQAEAVALAVDRQTITRSLSYAKAKDAVPTIRKFLTARGDVISDERTNSLIISDIPSVLPNLDRLISQLDKKTQEVEIEVRVVSATRSFSRDLGVQLGFNWGNGVTTVAGSNPNGATSIGNVPIFSNFGASGATTGLSFSNITSSYGVDAILTAAESHSLAKVLSRPRIVTQSNVKAEVKQGLKLPVYTSGTSVSNSSVSYIDAVLRLSVLPQITADNTIFLTVDVENTQPVGDPLSNGNFELSTQQATTQVLVTDGGTVMIGGVIQTTNSVSTTQTPVLGNIPWLGNLFKERSVKTESDELIFFITPKIIQT